MSCTVLKCHCLCNVYTRIDLMRIRIRIRIQHFSNCGSGFRIRIPDPDSGSGSRNGSRIRITYPDPGFDDLKFKKIIAGNLVSIFLIKNVYLSLGLHKGRPSYNAFSPQKRTSSTGSGSRSAIWMRIRIQQLKLMRIHAEPDPKPWVHCRPLCCVSQIDETVPIQMFRYRIRRNLILFDHLDPNLDSDLQIFNWAG